MNTHEKIVDESLDGVRLDSAVRALWGASWSRVRAWIAAGKIFIAGEPCLDEARIVRQGETLELRMDARRPRLPTDIDRGAILYADEHLVVVLKPAGVLTVPFDEPDRGALDEQVRRLLSARGDSRRAARPALFVVHRLDKGTSGVLVFGRTATARDHLAQQFRDHSVKRRYLALAHGAVGSARFESHLVVDRGDGLRGSSERAKNRSLRRQGGGKRAVTHVEALEALSGATLVSCRLETGRTNQIRIHLSEVGHPLLGETTYLRDYQGPVIPAPRLMLHAESLGFVHPKTGAEVRFSQPMPEDMERVLAFLRGK